MALYSRVSAYTYDHCLNPLLRQWWQNDLLILQFLLYLFVYIILHEVIFEASSDSDVLCFYKLDSVYLVIGPLPNEALHKAARWGMEPRLLVQSRRQESS